MDTPHATSQASVMDIDEARRGRRGRILAVLREAAWLTPARARAYATMLLAGMLAVAATWVVTATDGMDSRGKPIGTDFAHYWTAGRLALEGRPAAAWDWDALHAAQAAKWPGIGVTPFLYPPPFLLLCSALALLPYGAALAAWLSASLDGLLACAAPAIPSGWTIAGAGRVSGGVRQRDAWAERLPDCRAVRRGGTRLSAASRAGGYLSRRIVLQAASRHRGHHRAAGGGAMEDHRLGQRHRRGSLRR